MPLTPVLDLSTLDGNTGFRLDGINPGDYSGVSVASAGDVNGDGFDDLIIGAFLADPGADASAGQSYVVFGKASGFAATIDLSALDGTNGFRLDGIDAGDRSGYCVASAGDLNGDGFDDLVIGAFRASPGADSNAGESYVVFGKASGFAASLDLSTLDGSNGFRLDGIDAFDRSGLSVASAGDVNGDGFDDLVICAYVASPDGVGRAGETYVLFGKAESFGAALDLSTLDGSNGFRLDGVDPYDNSGRRVSSAGDVNGDGFDDLLIGASEADPGGDTSAGESYVVFGKAGGFAASLELSALDGSNGFRLDGIDADDHSGFSVAAAGDVNGDGFDDLLIGAYGGDPGGDAFAGESYVVFGKAGGFAASLDLTTLNGSNGFRLEGVSANDYSGYSVASAGDVNGDGFDDMVIGAFRASPDGVDSAGASFVVFGKAGGFAAVLDLSTLDGSNGFRLDGVGVNDYTGVSVASAGDVNGDGFDDLMIGAGAADPDAVADAGASYLVFGRDFSGIVTHAGNATANTLNGSAGADIMVAGLGNDTVNGSDGDDALSGGAGNDRLAGGEGADRLNGGNGTDTAYYSNSAGAVTVNLATDVNTGAAAAGDHLQDIENVIGSGQGDTLTGDQRANVLEGRSGADLLLGGRGNDSLLGGDGNDSLGGGGGNDLLQGGAGDDTYLASTGASYVEALDAGIDTLRSATTATLGANIENLLLSGALVANGAGNELANSLSGNGAANVLTGHDGNDTLSGGLGNDTLVGGAGLDELRGGGGDDSYTVAAGDSIIEGLDQGFDTVQSTTNWTLAGNLEKLQLNGADNLNGTGNTLANTIIGNSGNNLLNGDTSNDSLSGGLGADTLEGGVGADELRGGDGDDTYRISGADLVIEGVGLGYDTVETSTQHALTNNVEKLVITGTANVRGSGNGGDNLLLGNIGNNTLSGGNGADTLDGGAGNDRLIGGSGADSLAGAGGSDILLSGTGADAMSGGNSPDTFVFETAIGVEIDTITDFASGIDRISLDDDVFTAFNAALSTALTAGQLQQGAGISSAQDSNDRIIYNSSTGALYYDADGLGGTAAVQFAQLGTGAHPATLQLADFGIAS